MQDYYTNNILNILKSRPSGTTQAYSFPKSYTDFADSITTSKQKYVQPNDNELFCQFRWMVTSIAESFDSIPSVLTLSASRQKGGLAVSLYKCILTADTKAEIHKDELSTLIDDHILEYKLKNEADSRPVIIISYPDELQADSVSVPVEVFFYHDDPVGSIYSSHIPLMATYCHGVTVKAPAQYITMNITV